MAEKATRRRFPAEAKKDLVALVIDGGRKCSDVAAEHQVPVASVYAWVRQARLRQAQSEGSGQTSAASLQAENNRLRKELKIAREHALFLRRTAAFFASLKK